MAAIVLLTTSLACLCHTCHQYSWLLDPAPSGIYPLNGATTVDTRGQTHGSCLACAFLSAINAGQISLYLLALSALLIGQRPVPRFAGLLVAGGLASSLRSRAPPRGLARA